MNNELIELKKSLESKIHELELKNNELNEELLKENKKNLTLIKIIDITKSLKEQLDKLNLQDLKLNNEKMIVVNFESVDGKINYPVICKNSSYFMDAMKDFLINCPEYSQNDGNDLVFIGNGTGLIKTKKMEEQGFNGYTILVNKIDI